MNAAVRPGPAQPADLSTTLAGTQLRHLRVVQAAEAILLRGDCAPALRLRTTCRILGVSPRGLHHAFIAVHGVSPGRYLRERRLALVHEALREAPDQRSAVKRAALALGFRHLGHFARAYRARFGELPSDTVAREMARDAAEVSPPAA